MIIASHNINSIRARLDRLLNWLSVRQPDVVCLQETKVEDKAFPYEVLQDAGYHVVHCGQKTYNGVAILSREPLEDVHYGMDDGDDDDQARLISATVRGLRVMSIYVPNGSTVDSDKYTYKRRWLKRLRAYLDQHHTPTDSLVLCGDYNVAPDEIDVHDPELWRRSVLFSDEIRAALQEVLDFGLVDAYRLHTREPGKYTWWDYRMLAFPKNMGLRIDHLFVTQSVAERLEDAEIDREERKGTKPSDHAPIWIRLKD